MRARSLLFPLVGLGLLTLGGCDHHPVAAEPDDEGVLVASVSGVLTTEFNGTGGFRLFTPPPFQGFVRPSEFALFASQIDQRSQRGQELELRSAGSGVPVVGRYPVLPTWIGPLQPAGPDAGAAPHFDASYSYIEGRTNQRFIARSGEVEITYSSPDRVEGSFHFTGVRICTITPEQPLCRWPLFPWDERPDLETLPSIQASGSFSVRRAPPVPGFGG
jgi:hypothetical protein